MKNRYLFMTNTMNVGGAETGLVELSNAMVEKGYDVGILLTIKKGPLLKKIDPRIKVYGLIEKGKVLKSFLNLFLIAMSLLGVPLHARMLNRKYDRFISYLEGFPNVFLSGISSSHKYTSVRVGIKTHTTAIDKLPWGKWLQDNSYKKYKRIHCVSDSTLKEFVQIYPQYEDKTVAITTGFDIDYIIQQGNENFDFDNTKVNIVSVGRVEEQKGYHISVEAIYQLSKKRDDFIFHIIGNFKTEYAINLMNVPQYKDLIDRGVIVFWGIQKNPYMFMKNADLILNSSLYEGFPRVMNESLVLNKFIVASNILPNIEVLKSSSYLVDLDPEKYCEILDRIIEKREYLYKIPDLNVKSKDKFVGEFIEWTNGG